MDYILANDIRNNLQAYRNKIEWNKFHSMNAYTTDRQYHVYIGNNLYYVKPFMSYETVVGFVLDGKFIEVGKYSVSTTRQVNRYCRENNLNKESYALRHI